jgi:hypothetical protein
MNRTLLALLLGVLVAATTATAASQSREVFTSDEAHLNLFGTYLNDADQTWGGGIGLETYYGKYFGIGVSTHLENIKGTFIDNIATEVTLRYPIQSIHLAPYAVGSYGYDFDRSEWFQAVGAGAEFRLGKTWGLFADYQWVFRNDSKNGDYIRLGVRISL